MTPAPPAAVGPPYLVRVAVPSPLARLFDYRFPASGAVRAGMRVRVSFGRGNRYQTGLVMGFAQGSDYAYGRLKQIDAVLDEQPLLDAEDRALLEWAAGYYHYPLGLVIQSALPVLLNKGEAAALPALPAWRLTAAGRALTPQQQPPANAHRQRALLDLLREQPQGLTQAALRLQWPNVSTTLRGLEAKGWIERYQVSAQPELENSPAQAPLKLNPAQAEAVQSVAASLGEFRAFLLDGVTGSGKTEVYLQLIQRCLDSGRQALVLVPEINLTPQMLARFRRRFAVPLAVLHSRLSDRERLSAWLQARDGLAPIVIGTRSAVWTPLARPGLFIVDEEHDLSYKQQDGLHYSARDLCVLRARRAAAPVLLGTATPSLDSLYNARLGRYQHLHLPERAGAARPPTLHSIDMRRYRQGGLSPPLLQAIRARLERGEQSLIYINRRGYAPIMMCHACGWIADCRHCSAHLNFHGVSRRLHCHHCGATQALPRACPSCGETELRHLGYGTERIETALQNYFPAARVLRIDSDSTRRKTAMEDMLARIQDGAVDILVGTQMLTKGHHFPRVTLVGIVNLDGGLFGSDFRSSERMAQALLQVAGRAGRARAPGEVWLQTWHPQHPLLTCLLRDGYAAFADSALSEREAALLPPYAYLALLRAEHHQPAALDNFMANALASAQRLCEQGWQVLLLGPAAAPLERRAGYFRSQLLLQASDRANLHGLLQPWLEQLRSVSPPKDLRWSLDVDPQDLW